MGHADGERGGGRVRARSCAWFNKRLNLKTLKETIESAALTNAMVFFMFFGATMFSFVFRALGGDELVVELLAHAASEHRRGRSCCS